MGISTAGIGSGLDVNSIVTGLMAVERKPLDNVNAQKASYQSKLSAYGTLKSSLSAFQTAVSALSAVSKFNAQTVTSANTAVLSATANGSATAGDYAVTVTQLAKSQKLASTGFANTTDVVGTGTLTISFGDYVPASVTPLVAESFTANVAKSVVTITIDSSNNTLAGVRDAINASNSSVSATIVNNGTSNQLVITSKDTGEVNSLKISVNDTGDSNNTDASGLSRLVYDPLAAGVKNMTKVQTEQDALLIVDGISVVKPSNTVTDVISGVTLSLLTPGSNVNVSVASNKDAVKASVTEFVDAFNKLDTTMRTLTKYDPAGKSSGILLGDGTARSIINQIRSVLNQSISTGGALTTLSQIGVSFQSSGQLALDSTRLSVALTSNFSEMPALFTRSAKATDPFISYVGSTSKTLAGTYAVTVNQLGDDLVNASGTINGVAATGIGSSLVGALGDASEGLNIKVSGGATGARGSVNFTIGFAAQLSDVVAKLLDSDGILSTKTDGINSSISRLDKQADAISYRLTSIEARYRAQFSSLDATLASMQKTSSFLSQQLLALNR